MVVVWECKAPGYKEITYEHKSVIYPHAIVYDFEAYLDEAKIYSATKDLTFENVHVPISVSVGDTLNQQPTHLCERDSKVLIEKFMKGNAESSLSVEGSHKNSIPASGR